MAADGHHHRPADARVRIAMVARISRFAAAHADQIGAIARAEAFSNQSRYLRAAS